MQFLVACQEKSVVSELRIGKSGALFLFIPLLVVSLQINIDISSPRAKRQGRITVEQHRAFRLLSLDSAAEGVDGNTSPQNIL